MLLLTDLHLPQDKIYKEEKHDIKDKIKFIQSCVEEYNYELGKNKLNTIFENSVEYQLGDLLDIKYGLIENKCNQYIIKDGELKENVLFLTPVMIRAEDNAIEHPNEIAKIILEKYDRKDGANNIKKSKKNNEKLREITKSDLLTKDDLLLTTKGYPRLIEDKLGNTINEYRNIVATHHFIVLRFKNNILNNLNIDKILLKSLLKLITDISFSKLYKDQAEDLGGKNKKGDNNKSIITLIPALKIDSIKSTSVKIPKKLDDQKALLDIIVNLEAIQKYFDDNKLLFNQHFLNIK